MWNNSVSSYLHFTKKERTGIITLLVLIVLPGTAPLLFPFFIKQKVYDHAAFEKEIATLKIKQPDNASTYPSGKNFAGGGQQSYYEKDNGRPVAAGSLFYFDPNTLDKAGWEKLGIREKTAGIIQNYTSKGGKFRRPEDIDKIWGLSDEEVERLLPYVKIKSDTGKEAYYAKKYDRPAYERKKYTPVVVNINNDDTAAYIALPGIGSKLAQRIVTFRDKLGGFYSVEQVGETFGLPDSVFQKIKSMLTLSSAEVKQININTATLEELKAHPYIRYHIANAIVQYRVQHGLYSNLSDLKKIMLVNDEIFSKVAPYLKVN
jgi:competence protein ComEA